MPTPENGLSHIVPGPQPGMLLDKRTGEYLEAKQRSDRIFYDTEQIITPITAGVSYFFFRNLNFPAGNRKTSIFTNMVTQQQFPSGWHAMIWKVSFRALKMELTPGANDWTTAEDMVRVLEEGAMILRKANQRTEAEGRLDMFPSPDGLHLFANGPVIPDISMVNNGVPSAAAVPALKYPIAIENMVTFEIEVEYPRGGTLDAFTYLLCELHTTLVQPIV